MAPARKKTEEKKPGDSPPADAAEAARRLKEAGRNDPCPCGSGRKYKKCHLAADEAAEATRLAKEAEEARRKAEKEGVDASNLPAKNAFGHPHRREFGPPSKPPSQQGHVHSQVSTPRKGGA